MEVREGKEGMITADGWVVAVVVGCACGWGVGEEEGVRREEGQR
jgi:hypothetical protein